MITEIRKNMRSSTTKILLLVMCATLVISLISPLIFKNQLQSVPWALRVNNQEVPYTTFVQELASKQNMISMIRTQLGSSADELLASVGLSDPRAAIIEALAHEQLIIQMGKKAGFVINPVYAQEQLSNPEFASREMADYVPAFTFNSEGSIDLKRLQDYLRRRGLTFADVENKLDATLMKRLTLEVVSSAEYVPLFEEKMQLGSEFAIRSYTIGSFLRDACIAQEKKHTPTLNELAAFFADQNKRFQRYLVPEQRAGKVFTFDPHSYGIAITPDEIARYYESHTSDYIKEPTLITVRRILAKDNHEAQELYNQLTESPQLFASKGDLLPAFTRGKHDPVFEKTAFSLKKDGDISPVIHTAEGFQILQRVSKKMPTYKSLQEVSASIKALLTEKAFQQAFSADIAANHDALDAFSATKKASSSTIALTPVHEKREVKELFGITKGKVAFYIDGSTGFAVELTERVKAHTPELETILDQVKHDFYVSKADKSLEKLVADVKQKVASGESFDQAVSELGGSLTTTPAFSYKNAKTIMKNFGIPKNALSIDKVGVMVSYPTSKGMSIASLRESKPFSMEEIDQDDYKKALDRIERQSMKLFVNGFLASLYRNAKIDTNPILLQS